MREQLLFQPLADINRIRRIFFLKIRLFNLMQRAHVSYYCNNYNAVINLHINVCVYTLIVVSSLLEDPSDSETNAFLYQLCQRMTAVEIVCVPFSTLPKYEISATDTGETYTFSGHCSKYSTRSPSKANNDRFLADKR